MTPAEYELLSAQMRLLAAETMVGWLTSQFRALLQSLPTDQRAILFLRIQQQLSEQQSQLGPIANRDRDAAKAMAGTELFHEAFEDLSRKLIQDVKPGT